ncbi:complement C3-like [Tachysurus ichikawai]
MKEGKTLSKTRGGGVRVYINTQWCKNSVLVSTYCSSSMEFVTVRCRPFYLPREFTTVFIVGVYIPHSANAKEALSELYGAISDLQNVHPDGLFIIVGDLKSVLPKFHQHVDFATRGENTLDLVYRNIPGVYPAEPRPHLSYSDHNTYANSSIQTTRQMLKTGSEAGRLQPAVTSYISKCIDDVTVSKTITTRSNQKPWMTANVRVLLRTRDLDFRTGDRVALTTARAKLS